MKPSDIIQRARLLRQREEAFVTVWECEERVRRRLGGAEWPWPAPPALPSRQRHRGGPPSTRRPPAAAESVVRRLRPGEDAFRLTGSCRGQAGATLTADPAVARALLAAAVPSWAVSRLETVRLDAAGTAVVVECLWEAPATPPGMG
ncbi:MAG: hypothetical protein GX595_04160 [Lentisphaerae bacterium]|nr:hypothetical protein [Lentisphaerota bacterium]